MEIKNLKVYGLEDSFRASKFPMLADITTANADYTHRIETLAKAKHGTGHDNFLNGIVVQFDLTLSNKCWVELQRYHFIDFVSSQSTMHRITNFDLKKSYNKFVDSRIIDIMTEKVINYNKLKKEFNSRPQISFEEEKILENLYLEILYSNPAGFQLTARMTTNYRQLKTIYLQRKNHRLSEWREFCKFLEDNLPYSNLITDACNITANKEDL